MDITLTVEKTVISASLVDTPTANDFARLLPLTLTLSDFHKTEKVAGLPRRLTVESAPAGTSAKAGDLTYYSPWGNLAIFYTPFAHSIGLINLGALNSGLDVINSVADGTPVTIQLAAAGEAS